MSMSCMCRLRVEFAGFDGFESSKHLCNFTAGRERPLEGDHFDTWPAVSAKPCSMRYLTTGSPEPQPMSSTDDPCRKSALNRSSHALSLQPTLPRSAT